ncbi:hypothetical protein MBLNU13_g02761t2 [Cladosporium sp. NU13]
MARKSQRLSDGAATALPSHKRTASSTSLPGGDAKKTKTQKATPTKSQYFSKGKKAAGQSGSQDDEDASTPEEDEDDDPPSAAEEDLSEFGSAPESDDEGDDDDDDEEYESEVEKPKSRRKSASANTMTASSKKQSGGELWREGVKTGLGPGQEVIIKKPKARPAGKVPYSDETIHPNTLLFLQDLKQNNNREWLKMHDPDFRQSEKDWFSFVEKLTERLVEIDDTVPELPVKDIIFRIYRDVRFSKDPTPYKVSPKDSFVGGGLWHPEAAPTAALRQAIDQRSRQLKNVLSDENIRKEFLKGAPLNDSKVVKAFVAANASNALKTRPKGYDADHPDIELLRLRNFTIGRSLTEDELLGPGGLERVSELLGSLKPFVTYLNSVVMPDEPESDGDEEDEDEDDEDDEGEDDEEESSGSEDESGS